MHGVRTSTVQDLVDLGLVQELRVLGLHRLELNRNLLARRHVRAEIDVAERAGTDLAPQTVLLADTKLHREGRGRAGRTWGRPAGRSPPPLSVEIGWPPRLGFGY